jgi:hypothetical protein
LQVGEARERGRVGDPGAGEVELLQVGEVGEWGEIGDRSVRELERLQVIEVDRGVRSATFVPPRSRSVGPTAFRSGAASSRRA